MSYTETTKNLARHCSANCRSFASLRMTVLEYRPASRTLPEMAGDNTSTREGETSHWMEN